MEGRGHRLEGKIIQRDHSFVSGKREPKIKSPPTSLFLSGEEDSSMSKNLSLLSPLILDKWFVRSDEGHGGAEISKDEKCVTRNEYTKWSFDLLIS